MRVGELCGTGVWWSVGGGGACGRERLFTDEGVRRVEVLMLYEPLLHLNFSVFSYTQLVPVFTWNIVLTFVVDLTFSTSPAASTISTLSLRGQFRQSLSQCDNPFPTSSSSYSHWCSLRRSLLDHGTTSAWDNGAKPPTPRPGRPVDPSLGRVTRVKRHGRVSSLARG